MGLWGGQDAGGKLGGGRLGVSTRRGCQGPASQTGLGPLCLPPADPSPRIIRGSLVVERRDLRTWKEEGAGMGLGRGRSASLQVGCLREAARASAQLGWGCGADRHSPRGQPWGQHRSASPAPKLRECSTARDTAQDPRAQGAPARPRPGRPKGLAPALSMPPPGHHPLNSRQETPGEGQATKRSPILPQVVNGQAHARGRLRKKQHWLVEKTDGFKLFSCLLQSIYQDLVSKLLHLENKKSSKG